MINLTPHAIVDVASGQTFAPSGDVVRVSQTRTLVGLLPCGSSLYQSQFGDVVGLPADLQPGQVYIVSTLVKQAIQKAGIAKGVAFISPGPLVRDDNGNVIGCQGFDC